MNLLDEPWLPVRDAGNHRHWIAPAALGDPAWIAFDADRADFNGALAQFAIGLLQTAAPAKSAAQWHRLPADFAAPHLPDDGLLSRFRGHDFPYDPQRLRFKLQLDELDTQGARQFGELLHRAIETVAQEGIAQWDSQRLARSRDGWLAMLRQLGYRGAAVPAVTRLQQIVQDCLQSPTFRWLLDPLHQQAEN